MEGNMNMAAVIGYDENLEKITVSLNGIGFGINAREVSTVEKLFRAMNISYTEQLGNLLEESEMMMNEYRKDDLYQLGIQAGIQQMMDKIESNYERGKPVSANGKLYWMKDENENLQDVMDDIENMYSNDDIKNRIPEEDTKVIRDMFTSGKSIYEICKATNILRFVVEYFLLNENMINLSECKYDGRNPFEFINLCSSIYGSGNNEE